MNTIVIDVLTTTTESFIVRREFQGWIEKKQINSYDVLIVTNRQQNGIMKMS